VEVREREPLVERPREEEPEAMAQRYGVRSIKPGITGECWQMPAGFPTTKPQP
jgi:hypothetical protein